MVPMGFDLHLQGLAESSTPRGHKYPFLSSGYGMEICLSHHWILEEYVCLP